MRIISGRFRSRLLKPVPGFAVRPTPDRLREALFNVLAPEIEDTVFLDAYAGTGAAGIEALSRGARRAIFIEARRDAADVITGNLAALGVTAEATLLRGKAAKFLPNIECDIAFIDPPYDQTREYLFCLETLQRCPLVLLQHDVRMQLPEACGNLRKVRTLRQGDNVLTFYRLQEE